MKNLIILITFLSIAVSVFSQDRIVKNSGEEIICTILKEDSTAVYFKTFVDTHVVETYLNRSSIKEVKYSSDPAVQLQNKINEKNALTFGFLFGGGSMLGGDLEIQVAKRFSFQLGAGFVGYGAGINFHMKPYIRSSFISLQYWHQGVGDDYTQSLVGPNYVFRTKKWFTAQVGLGFLLEQGPAWPEDTESSPVMLTYAIGAYIPW